MTSPSRFNEKGAFVSHFELMADAIHQTSIEHGFWNDKEPQLNSTKLMLVVSELGEACEADRLGNPADQHLPQHGGLGVELADAVIRIMDLAHKRGIPLGQIIVDKCRYNEGRPFKHGGKAY